MSKQIDEIKISRIYDPKKRTCFIKVKGKTKEGKSIEHMLHGSNFVIQVDCNLLGGDT